MTIANFHTLHYQNHNLARLKHLESLGLPLQGRRVLEVGSGPGDHTGFYLQRDCDVVSTDARQTCLTELNKKYPNVKTCVVDMNNPTPLLDLGIFEVIHAYGLLYHLNKPDLAIAAMAAVCSDLLLLETCVSQTIGINLTGEVSADFTQAIDGLGCRPTRKWVFEELKTCFQFVYQTRTQPNHPEFPTDWSVPSTSPLSRAVFIASRKPLDESVFSPCLLDRQL